MNRNGSSMMTPWQSAITKGIAAATRNRVPAMALWIFGAVLITSYHYIPAVHDGLESVGRLKTSWGWVFSMISTGIFGGLIPVLLPKLLNHDRAKISLEIVIFSTLLWAYKGIETDYFYRLQGVLFGTSADIATIAIKTLIDQFVWVPLFGLVNVMMFYCWRDNGYSFRRTWQSLGAAWYWSQVLPVLFANWVVWIPAVLMIYALPSALQIPVQNLILCFWVLVLVFFTAPSNATADNPNSADQS